MTVTITEAELQATYRHYFRKGQGRWGILCSSAGRVTFFQSEGWAQAYEHSNCGRNCDRYSSPHLVFKLEAPAAPPPRVPASFRRLVADD